MGRVVALMEPDRTTGLREAKTFGFARPHARAKLQWHRETSVGSNLYLATPNFFVEKLRNLRCVPSGMKYDPSLQVWRRIAEAGMAGVPPPLVYPGDEHLLAHAIESYARRTYGLGTAGVSAAVAGESSMVDATGKASGGAFGIGRNIAGTDATASAVGRAKQEDLDGEEAKRKAEAAAKAAECVLAVCVCVSAVSVHSLTYRYWFQVLR